NRRGCGACGNVRDGWAHSVTRWRRLAICGTGNRVRYGDRPALPGDSGAHMVPPSHGVSMIGAYRGCLRKRSALVTTDTELRLIANAAIIGDSVMPNHGYRTPAARGMPMPL